MLVLFVLLVGVISSYAYLTDSDRVRGMAESYLSELLGGKVEVGGANLSIFEGLRLDDVRVLVDGSNEPDSVLFSAQTFLVRYDLHAMLRGRLAATQIIATEPHVSVTENVDTQRWNYQRMQPPKTPDVGMGGPDAGRMPLPEILLRNAQIDYSEIRDGRHVSLGSLAIEAQLTPLASARGFRFDLTSRGASDVVGPAVSGSYDMASGVITASLRNFEFGRDIRSMLPAEVRTWWEQHELAGRVDIPVLTYTPAKNGAKRSAFRVETELNNVTLTVKPQELMGRDEAERRYTMLAVLNILHSAGVDGPVPMLVDLVEPSPIRLTRVDGTFVFTEDGIDVRDVTGRVESNRMQIGGRIDGYTPDAPFSLRIASEDKSTLYIPASPRYINSLPPPVRELYSRLRPQGEASVTVNAVRDTPGARPEVSGEVKIIEGQFVFDKFPYPMREATGRIVFGRRDDTGMDFLEIQNLRGRGIAGGPNADRYITVNGVIGPFGPTSAFNIRVEGKDITCEPALRAAFPVDVQRSLKMFTRPSAAQEMIAGDLDKLPEDPNYPAFRGDFICDVIRPLGLKQRWTVNIDLDVKQADGALVVFPYPLRDVSMRLKIRDGYVEIIDAITRKGDSSLKINGRVDFGAHKPLRPNLKIVASNVPIDDDLLAALSPMQRAWMQKVGIGGTIDLTGDVFPRDASAATQPHAATEVADSSSADNGDDSNIQYSFDINLRDGTMWPVDGTFAVSGLHGTMRLAPQRLMLTGLQAKRGEADIALRGSVAWPKNRPRITLNASATDLALDSALYAQLPPAARRGWDEVQPQGTVDAEISYSGGFQATDADNNAPSPGTPGEGRGEGSATSAYEVILRPKNLSATVRSLPYRLDDIQGTVSIFPDRVILKDLTAAHGPGKVSLSGKGMLGDDASWDLLLSARDLPVDDDLRKALPDSLKTVLEGLNLRGALAFDFSKLTYRPNEPAGQASSAIASLADVPETQPAESRADIDFTSKIWLNGAKVDVGVPLKDVVAEVEVSGAVRKGKLSELSGQVNSESFTLAERTVSGFHADLRKPPEQDALQIGNMRAALAGGEMAGEVNLAFPDIGPSRYALNLVVRDADVNQLAPQEETDADEIHGRLSASLSLEGDWSDSRSRRGRGDVLVAGRNMYRIPLVLGLLQVTNLSLPATTPFNEATASYSMDGSRVTFEGIEIKSHAMMMQGDGYLDFDSKKVSLDFVTDNPGWPPVPIVGELFRGAKNELMRIHVRGTIQQPKVSAASMSTFTTTVDEVFEQ